MCFKQLKFYKSILSRLCITGFIPIPLLLLQTFKSQWQLCVPPVLTIINSVFCINGFRMFLSMKTDYFLKQFQETDLCNCKVSCFI